MNTNSMNYNTKVSNKETFRNFQSYCKYYGMLKNEYGQQILKVTNEDNNNIMIVQYTSKEAKIGKRDTINVRGLSKNSYSLDELINIGVAILGEDAFRKRKEEKVLKRTKTQKPRYIDTSRI